MSTSDSVKLPDGRMLHFVCMGKGSPTVILTAGLGDFAAVAAVLVAASPGAAQNTGPAQPIGKAVATRPSMGPGQVPTSLDTAAREDVVSALASALRQRYVFPDVGDKAAARIDAALAAGEYDKLSDPASFASRLDADVGAIAHDKHLHVISMKGPPSGPQPAAMDVPSADAGVVRADRLTGGVGYLEVVGGKAMADAW